MARDCSRCGCDVAVANWNGEQVCRDCFADSRANMILSFEENEAAEGEYSLDDHELTAIYERGLAQGYEDVDCLIGGGRLPY